jgi:hypothetical protein
MNKDDMIMEKYINKIYCSLLALLLTIIGFFLVATYNKITDTNTMVYQLQIELAQMREKEAHFLTYQEVSMLIDRKIEQYHKNQ